MNKLIFDNVEVSKKEFYESKKGIKLKDVNADKIVVSNKVKGNNDTSKVPVGYMMNDIVVLLCLLLPQMSGSIKYFENGGKSMSFKIDEDWVYLKYNEIWNRIKEFLGGLKLYSEPIYDDSYIKTKVKNFSEVINV